MKSSNHLTTTAATTLTGLLLIGQAMAAPQSGPRTDVFLTNKTRGTITLSLSGRFPARSAYTRGVTSIRPGQRARILRVSRNKGIKNGKVYEFFTRANLPNGNYVRFGQRLRGTFAGSKIWMSSTWKNGGVRWLSDSNVTQRARNSNRVGSLTYAVDARWHFKPGWLYHNVECTITETGVVTRANELNIWQHNIQQRPSSEGMQHQTGLGHSQRSRLSTIYLPDAIRRYDSSIDVITVNEAFTASLRPELKANMRKAGFLHATNVLAKKGGAAWSGGVMVFSKHRITRRAEYIYKNYAAADRNADKGVLYVRINKHGRPYNIFATHMNASYDFKGKSRLPMSDKGRRARAKQFVEMRSFVLRQRIPSNEPVILVGDMNVDMISEAGKRGDEYADMLRKLHAVHTRRAGHRFTLDANTNEFADRDDGPAQYLDYILWGKGFLRPTSATGTVVCLKSGGRNVARKGRSGSFRDLSDHYPIQGKFVFPARIPALTRPVARPRPTPRRAGMPVAGQWQDANGMPIALTIRGSQVSAHMQSRSGRRWWTHATATVRSGRITMQHYRGRARTERKFGRISADGRRILWSHGKSWTLRSRRVARR